MRRSLSIVMCVCAVMALLESAPAGAQGWNYYSAYTSLPTIPFAGGAMTPSNTASVFLNLNGVSSQFTMDTGSTGVIASSKYFTPGPNDINQGPGSVTYTSSNLTYKGTFYLTNVGILQTAQNGTGTVAGQQLATSRVTILAADQVCDKSGSCGKADIAYMGVGFNRDQLTTNAPAGSNINAFTNVTSLASGAPLSTYRQGYVISNSGITLGLSAAATQNFAVVQLLPDTSKSYPTAGITWSTAPMTVVVNNGKTPNSGTLLPDTGINYMFLSTIAGNQPASTTPCGTPDKPAQVCGHGYPVPGVAARTDRGSSDIQLCSSHRHCGQGRSCGL